MESARGPGAPPLASGLGPAQRAHRNPAHSPPFLLANGERRRARRPLIGGASSLGAGAAHLGRGRFRPGPAVRPAAMEDYELELYGVEDDF